MNSVTTTGGLTVTTAMACQLVQWIALTAFHVTVPDAIAATLAAGAITSAHALISAYQKKNAANVAAAVAAASANKVTSVTPQ